MQAFSPAIPCALVLAGLAALGPPATSSALAQTDTATLDARRARVSDALAKGDLVQADKAMAAQPDAALATSSVVFEELKACGFYPQESRLECVLDVKQPGGFGGNVGQFGSYEFVYFCVDWNDDGAFSTNEATGLGIVHLHDESDGAPISPQRPVQYAVYRDIDPPGSLTAMKWLRTQAGVPMATTSKGSTRRARAILSWNAAPTSCSFTPIWGNQVNFRIRFDPIR